MVSKLIFDPQTLIEVGPGSTELIKIVVDEEIISADDETSEESPLPLNDPFAGE